MADEEDLSLLKRNIVAVDKLVNRNAEISLLLKAKQKELDEAKIGARDEVRKVMLELEEVREQLEVATKKERRMQKNQEQASRFALSNLQTLKILY